MTPDQVEERLRAVRSELPRGGVAYVDRDWLAGGGASIPALSFSADGDVWWCGRPVARLPAGTDPTRVFASALGGMAREAASAAVGCRGRVEVVGDGFVAAEVRRLAAAQERAPLAMVGAVVDTTGDPDVIRAALERVADLGIVVLAGEPAGRSLDVDFYSTVHRRGLVVAGVAGPSRHLNEAGAHELPDAEEPFDVAFDGSLADALWYRVEA